MRRARGWSSWVLGCLLALSPAMAASPEPAPSPEVRAENPPEFVERCRVRIENKVGGAIEGSKDGGKTWTRIGSVRLPTTKVNPAGYTASKWAQNGHIAATAVNGIHIKTDHNRQTDRGVIFSLVPREQGVTFESGAAARNPTTSIYTDIPGGTGIFGGEWSPFVGNRVGSERGGRFEALPQGYVPALGDVLLYLVERPRRYPKAIVFHNAFGGLITLEYESEPPKPIGQVLKPVAGVGRFEGALFTGVGRIRANHCGVIDVSCSPFGMVGGFQIIPKGHAESPELDYVRVRTQWMVVGPLNALDPSWEGIAPLFSYFLLPRYSPDDLAADNWVERLMTRFWVDVRIKGGEWQPMPSIPLDLNAPLPPQADTALKDVTHVRIVFPPPVYF